MVQLIDDVTRMQPYPVREVVVPRSTEEVADAISRCDGPISIGGGRYSMGGQIAAKDSLHLDMREMTQVLGFDKDARTIRVQSGITWRAIQDYIDPHNLSVKIMQTYANFTVGGSLSVNVHGRYVGLGPLILSVRSITLVLADGAQVDARPSANAELFYGAIGGYGGVGVIVEVELELDDNVCVARHSSRMPIADYWAYFKAQVRNNPDAVFHNADIYPPHYSRVNAVTWAKTGDAPTVKKRLQPVGHRPLWNPYFFWAFTETLAGKWRREHVYDPLIFARKKVHWRNYEASYDVAELEPIVSKSGTFVLQEYFVPVEQFDAFVPKMAEILQRYDVNVLNISIRHAVADPGSLLAWARGETFAFVLYYKQRTAPHDLYRVACWTRELVQAAIDCGGAYYLPYQPHATANQFHAAYPRAREYFTLKAKVDPETRFTNALWEKYYQPEAVSEETEIALFKPVMRRDEWADKLYRFLQVVFNLHPEDRFFALIAEACEQHETDEAIYRHIQAHLKQIKGPSQITRYILPAIRMQKQEMARQTLELLGEGSASIDGYLEIGATGFYYSELRKHRSFAGALYVMDEKAPTYGPADLLGRGRLATFGHYLPLADYSPISPEAVPDASLDLVTCYIGLHHCAPEKLSDFIASIARVLRPGGRFILRDHAVDTPEMARFVSLIHTVFNAGMREPWEVDSAEPRYFNRIAHWVESVEVHGLKDMGARLLQANDPSDNVLMGFVKA